MMKRFFRGTRPHASINTGPDDPLAAYLNGDLAIIPGAEVEPSACAVCDGPLVGLSNAFSDGGCGHVFHKACVAKHSQCPICLESFSPVKQTRRAKRQGLGRLATDDASIVLGQTNPALPNLLGLEVDLRSSCQTIGPGASDAHVVLQLQPSFPAEEAKGSPAPLKVAFLLDLQPLMLAKKRFKEPKLLCSQVVALLQPSDQWSVLTTAKSSAKRVIKSFTSFDADSVKNVESALESWSCDETQVDLDFVKTVQQTMTLLEQAGEGKSCIILISDGNAAPDKLQSKRLKRCFRGMQTAFLCLSSGLCHNPSNMRILAKCCDEGVFLDGSRLEDVRSFMNHVRAETLLLPLTNVRVDLTVQEGAMIVCVNEDDFSVQRQSFYDASILISSIAPFELRQIWVSIRVPEADRGESPVRPSPSRTESTLRLAELEQMVHMLPSRLVTCNISYSHPVMPDSVRLSHEERVLTIKRGSKTLVDATIIGSSIQQEGLQILREALVNESNGQKEVALGLLRDAEQTVHALCTEHNISTADFEPLLSEFSIIRFRLSPRYHVAAVRRRLSSTQVVQMSPDLRPMQSYTASDALPQTPLNKCRSHLWDQVKHASPFYVDHKIAIISPLAPARPSHSLYSQQLLGRSSKALPITKQATVSKVASPVLIHPGTQFISKPSGPSRQSSAYSVPGKRLSTPSMPAERPSLSIMTDARAARLNLRYDDSSVSPLKRLGKQAQGSSRPELNAGRLPSTSDIQKLIRRSSGQPGIKVHVEKNKPLPVTPLQPGSANRLRAFGLDPAASSSRPGPGYGPSPYVDPARNIWRMQKAERGEELSYTDPDSQRFLSEPSQERIDSDGNATPTTDYFGLRRGQDGRPRVADVPSPEVEAHLAQMGQASAELSVPSQEWPLISPALADVRQYRAKRVESTHYSTAEPVTAAIVEETECATSRAVSRTFDYDEDDDGQEQVGYAARQSGDSIQLQFGGRLKWDN